MIVMDTLQVIVAITFLTFAGSTWASGGPYPPLPDVNAKAERAQILAELHEAQRLGVMPGTGESDPPAISQKAMESIAQAGLRAAGKTQLASFKSDEE